VPNEGDVVSGVLVRHHFTHRIMTPADLRTYTQVRCVRAHAIADVTRSMQLATSTVAQRLLVPFYRTFDKVARALRRLFDNVCCVFVECAR
jgi:hypothetical protein